MGIKISGPAIHQGTLIHYASKYQWLVVRWEEVYKTKYYSTGSKTIKVPAAMG